MEGKARKTYCAEGMEQCRIESQLNGSALLKPYQLLEFSVSVAFVKLFFEIMLVFIQQHQCNLYMKLQIAHKLRLTKLRFLKKK